MGLENFPHLLLWYQSQQSKFDGFDSQCSIESTTWNLAHSLKFDLKKSFDLWYNTLQNFYEHSNEHHHTFVTLMNFCSQLGFDLSVQLVQWGEESFKINKEEEFLILMRLLSKKTDHQVLYFVVAWMAFNMDNYKLSIEQSYMVDSGPTCILRGQSYLELGDPEAAQQAFEEAIDHDHDDPLAWFQLAKTSWVQEKYLDAWSSLKQCEKITGGTPEIALFLGMLALTPSIKNSMLQEAWSSLSVHLEECKRSSEYVMTISKVAIEAKKIEWFNYIHSIVAWNEIKEQLVATKELGYLLSSLHLLGWHGLSELVLCSLADNASREHEL